MTKEATLVNKRRAKTRQKLLSAAAKVFVEKGIDATSIEHIITEAEISRGAFYTHFADKNALVKEVISQVYEFLIDAVGKIKLDSPEQVMEDIFDAYFQCWCQNADALVLSSVMESQYFQLIKVPHNQFVEKIVAAVTFVEKSGLLRTNDARLCLALLARTITPTLRALHKTDDFEGLFHQSMKGLLLNS
jgi:AcrR family transcriptional regulator